ncbi:phosphoribosylanthranilate isomerase [Erythrobacter rubeus]|uniref:N-(5'-phosphoribosyl)anthranilate isomerase n=1 Tax=Erythrobacter rubeus TaxID=2760803 RepID=A0ABR8KM24_9SPHN|nr:phosphoribosylanthranilate isomerase [Erythrobacter rubeus]MBD2841536.1 phosphoribosylanthranilate isomerase [Erythrobacter rubeus]
MAVQIKICGIREPRALEAVIAAGANFAGFIFHASSPRNLTLEEAADLTIQANGRIKRVALIVDPTNEFLDELFASARFEAIQLQGSESPERLIEIRERYGVRAWKAISVAKREDVLRANDYVGVADFILFDAKTPPGALPGGMGLRFDWRLLDGLDLAWPWGLAGGLDPENVDEAIKRTRAPLVDVCSGTESAPGVKDMDKIAAFCKAALQTFA